MNDGLRAVAPCRTIDTSRSGGPRFAIPPRAQRVRSVTTFARLILVIDPDPDFLGFMGTLLEDEGHRVDLAASSADARAALAARRPDLIISDLRVWPIPAGEVPRLLATDPQTRGIPVLLCSVAVDEVRDAVAALSPASIDILGKPFAIEELLERVDRLLAQGPRQSAGD